MDKWIKTKGWLKGYVKKKEKPDSEKSIPYGVTYYPLKCPKCGSKENKCYSSTPPVRYHKCYVCGHRFKSREAE